MKEIKRFYSSAPVFFIKFVLWIKKTKETWRNNRNFPLHPKTSRCLNATCPRSKSCLERTAHPASHEASILIPHDKYDHTQYPDQ